MVTSQILQNVYSIRSQTGRGTGFRIFFEEEEYLITVSHIFERAELLKACNMKKSKLHLIEIYHKRCWQKMAVRFINYDPVDDLIVFRFSEKNKLINYKPPILSTEGLAIGQDIYFLGFPFLVKSLDHLNFGFPLPYVKKGIFSAFGEIKDKTTKLIIEGYPNRGFSGGPLIFKKQFEDDFRIAGIIIETPRFPEPIFEQNEKNKKVSTPYYYYENSGFIEVLPIFKATEMIRREKSTKYG